MRGRLTFAQWIVGALIICTAFAISGEPSPSLPNTRAPLLFDGASVRSLSAEVRRRIAQNIRELCDGTDFDQALMLLAQWQVLEPDNPVIVYNRACVKSLAGRPEEAIEDLRMAIGLGWTDFRQMENDPDLTAARTQPSFEVIRLLNESAQRRRGERILAELRLYFGETCLYEVDHDLRLVFAAAVDPGALEAVRSHLSTFAGTLQSDLFTYGIEQHVVVILPDETLRLPAFVGGFFAPEQRVLVVRSVGREIHHEFMHALHWADMEARNQRHPVWIVEGLAVLFENVRRAGKRCVPEHSHRLFTIQELIRRERVLPLDKMLRISPDEFQKAALVTYPQSGSLVHYLFDHGLLSLWYQVYCESYGQDPTGAVALRTVLGKGLSEIELDWKSWVLKQRPPPVGVNRRTPYLGVVVEAHRAGLVVRDVSPFSPAALAGLAAGDVLETVGNQRVTDPLQLIKVVSEQAVGDTVDVEFRRNGERFLLRVRPGERPAFSL